MKRYRKSGWGDLTFGQKCHVKGQSVNGIIDLNHVVSFSSYPALSYLFPGLATLTQG